MQEDKKHTVQVTLVLILMSVIGYGYYLVFSVPSTFPVNKNFVVNENETLKSMSNRLKSDGFITSPLLFRAAISFFDKDRAIQLGGYTFTSPRSLIGVVTAFVEGKPSTPLLSVTIPEGSTSFEVASLTKKALPTISIDVFGEKISKYKADGKLFPSTYYLLPSYTEEDIVKLMLTTFTKKVTPIFAGTVPPSPLTEGKDVITLASILEGEAKNDVDMKIVAGILLARLSKGMPLQVDVAKETYKQKGLPFMPINNPGLMALEAVLHPTITPYLYYLTGKDGQMYYAKTFEEHKKNIQKYLK